MWLERQRREGGRARRGVSEKGDVDLCWRLNKHLLPYFARLTLDRITVEEVDRFRGSKVGRGRPIARLDQQDDRDSGRHPRSRVRAR